VEITVLFVKLGNDKAVWYLAPVMNTQVSTNHFRQNGALDLQSVTQVYGRIKINII
jgi:hypothetical protein